MALYPPIIASSLPAFDFNKGYIPIQFSISKYNSLSEINTLQITIKRHTSNVNVILTDMLSIPFDVTTEESERTLNKIFYNSKTRLYELNLSTDKISLEKNALYRMQLRFSSVGINSNINSSAYTNNAALYSEWSTVCIIKPIIAPTFYIKDLYTTGLDGFDAQVDSFSLDYPTADFVGVYSLKSEANKDGKETKATSSQILQRWRLRLLDKDWDDDLNTIDNHIIADSNWNFIGAYSYDSTEDPQQFSFSCNLNYEFPTNQTDYKLYFQIETRNGYRDGVSYEFTSANTVDPDSDIDGTISAAVNEEEGYIKVKINFAEAENELQNYVLRRTSSTSNFLYWEDIKYFIRNTNSLDTQIYTDYTAESGIIYKYGIQKINVYGRRGTLKVTKECMGQWEHAFLLEGYDLTVRQLKLKYDFDISSYKTNISESKTDTIGSRYPFIRRNGNMYYRSFPITGIISASMDDEQLFTNNYELYGTDKLTVQSTTRVDQSNEDIYEEFFGEYDNYVNRYNYTHERKFRERVEAFLYNNNVKLYKSMQEGNILVKLMQVSLTPKKQLGRLIYTFSATAYEVANVHESYWQNTSVRTSSGTKDKMNTGAGVFSDSNVNIVQTLNNNGFFNIGTYESNLTSVDSEWKIGQITCYIGYDQNNHKPIITPQLIDKTNKKGIYNNIQLAIINKYWGPYSETNQQIPDKDTTDNVVITGMKIRDIHIEVDNAPYLINANSNVASHTGTYFENSSQYAGTQVNFNGSTIIIPALRSIYNIMDTSEFNILNTAFTIGKDGYPFIGTVDFLYKLTYEVDYTKQSYKTVSKNAVGFLDYDDILLGGNAINLAHMKYKQEYTDSTTGDIVKQRITGIKEAIIDSDPGTEIEVTITQQGNEGQSTESVTQTVYINETGTLHLDTLQESSIITSLKIKGLPTGDQTNPYRKPDILIYYFATVKTEYFKAVKK